MSLLDKLVRDTLNLKDKLWIKVLKDNYLGNFLSYMLLLERDLLLRTLQNYIELHMDGFQFKVGDRDTMCTWMK